MTGQVKERFGLIWPRHVNTLTRLLITVRHTFGGDLDLFLVLAVIGERTFSARKADPAQAYDDWQKGGSKSVMPEGINARSISHFSGIPRETVRRKLAILIEKGWVARVGSQSLVATVKAREELEPLTLESIRYIEDMFALFEEVRKPPEGKRP